MSLSPTPKIRAQPAATTREDEAAPGDEPKLRVPRGVLVYRVYGALFFDAADKLETVLHQQHSEPDVLILKMDQVITMDASALHTLQGLAEKLKRRGKHLILSGPHTPPYFLMHSSGFFDEIGRENVCGSLESAIERARPLLKRDA